MKNSLENVKKRQDQILAILREKGTCETVFLAKMVAVSLPTIRRDINTLAAMGKIEKKHGWISYSYNPEFDEHKNEEIEKIKKALAEKAASLVKEGDTIFINSSSAALETVKFLRQKRLTIISNNIKISEFEYHNQANILLTGGEIRFPKEVLVGEAALNMIEKVNATISIIGCYGLTLEKGLTSSAFQEAKINHAMIKHTTDRVVVIADYRKIGNVANFTAGRIDEIDTLITDPFANRAILQALEKQGIEIIQVPL